MSAPAFAKMRADQQAIDHLVEGGRRWVIDKGLDFLGAWRQADDIERQTPDQGASVIGRGGLQVLGFEFREHIGIEGIARPGGILDGGWLGGFDRLPGPVLCLAFRQIEGRFCDWRCLLAGPRARRRSSRSRSAMTASGNLALGGILQVGVLIANCLYQLALVGLAWNQGGAIVAALEYCAGAAIDE